MSRFALAAVLLLVAAAPQETKWTNRKCCDANGVRPWKSYNKVGVMWTQPMDAAVKQARKTGKLLMVFQLVGDMDKEGC